MASRAGRLLGGLLDRFLPSPRPGRHRPWGRRQRTAPEPWPNGTPPASPPWGATRPPRQRPTADEIRLATASADRVDVRVVGTVPPDDALVDGEIEGEPDRAAPDEVTDDGAPDGHADAPGPGDRDAATGTDGNSDEDEDPDGGRRAPVTAAASAPPPRQRRLKDDLLAATAIAAVVLLALLTVVFRGPVGDWLTRQSVEQAAGTFARAWQGGRLGSVQYDPSSTGRPGLADADALSALVARRSQAVTAGLTSATPDAPTSVTLTGDARVARANDGARTATQRARVVWTLDGGRRWAYDTVLTLRQQGSRWRVVWSPQTVHPGLTADGGLVAERVQAARAPILGSGSRTLATTLVAHRVTFRSTSLIRPRGDLHRVADLTGLDRERLTDAVTSRPRGTTVPVAVLRDERWKQVSGRLLRIKGVTATPLRVAAPRTTTYARSLLGEALPASAATARASGGRIVAGELVGTTGLQRSFDDRLRGTSGLRVTVLPLPRAGALAPRAVPASDPPGRVLAELAGPVAGTPLQLTLDAGVQRAAQAAVDGVRGKRASLVAVDVRTGRVLAVASNVAEEWDRPLLGAYPPGSTFKIVTTWALTGQGVTPADELRCPDRIVVRGNPFRNAHAPVGTAPLARQFAESCNTAFAGLGDRVPDADVRDAARDLGLTVPYTGLGVGAFPGVVPQTPDAAVHAASLIGQGEVEVSPLSMAVASATVAGGRFRPPQLVLGTGRAVPGAGAPLDASRLGTMRSLMCETVRSGTATGLRSAPGGPVAGKTGTAQFGSPRPVGAHAWFTGYQGDLAFAVVVEKGGFGADAAVPLTRAFLRGVHAGERARPAASCGAATAALR